MAGMMNAASVARISWRRMGDSCGEGAASCRPFEIEHRRGYTVAFDHVHQFPAVAAQLVQLVGDFFRIGMQLEEFRGFEADDLVSPVRVGIHGFSRLGEGGRCVAPVFSRPALRSASRNTYSICALSERNSSLDQRCIASSTAALMRSG